MDGKDGAEALIAKLLNDPALREALAIGAQARRNPRRRPRPVSKRKDLPWPTRPSSRPRRPPAAEALAPDDFQSLLKKEFRPRDASRPRAGSVPPCDTLAEQALAHTTTGIRRRDQDRSQAIIAQLDQKLTEQINLILHHPDYQELEGAWRGLHHLVNNTETDQMLKIRVMNISKKELSRTLEKFEGTAWDQSPIFKKIYTEEYSMLGGEPFGCLVGDYYFDNSAKDVALLGQYRERLCGGAHAIHLRRRRRACSAWRAGRS